MLQVSEATRNIYFKDGVHKEFRVVFPRLSLSFGNSSIVKDSIRLKESVSSGDSVEFVGCIASSLTIKIRDLNATVKNTPIELYIKAGDTEEIPLFKGIVDSAVIQSDRHFKEITAYDALYKLSQKDISAWYERIQYPTTLKTIRKSLLSTLNLVDDGEEVTLPNDNLVIPEKYGEPNQLKAISVLKSICQINGCFGIIGRDGKFKWRYLVPALDRLFPSTKLYPQDTVLPVQSGDFIGYADFDYYKKLEYQEYSVKPVDQLIIRKSEDDPGISVGSGSNRYIIQNNIFTNKLDDNAKRLAANNILEQIGPVTYHPVNIEVQGLPYLECGDIISVYIPEGVRVEGEMGVDTFIVLERELRGDQILTDRYISDGDEEQRTFITDIQAQIDDLKENGGGGGGGDMDDYYTAEEVDNLINDSNVEMEDYVDNSIASMETPTGFKIVSCASLPLKPDPGTLYVVYGGVIII